MFSKDSFVISILILAVLTGCRTYKPAIPSVTPAPAAQSYIERYKDLAINEMIRTGVPASITLAQGMIESDFGRSTLARVSNNHFGIKCHNGWTGPSVRHDDDRRNECFRKYRNPEESFKDHSDFLKYGSRYSSLFEIGTGDYKAWAHGLKKAGYATNPDYANMLIRKIEENNLALLDGGKITKGPLAAATIPVKSIPGDPSVSRAKPDYITSGGDSSEGSDSPPVFNNNIAVHAVANRILENNRVEYLIVKPEDSVEKLEEEFQLLKWELKQYNDIEGELILSPGQILYLQPKRNKAEPGIYYHTCASGETMYTISQKYAIKLNRLYELNRLNPGVQIQPGQRLWLRMTKPE